MSQLPAVAAASKSSLRNSSSCCNLWKFFRIHFPKIVFKCQTDKLFPSHWRSPWWYAKVFFARLITKSAIGCLLLFLFIPLLLIHSLRTSICVCKHLYIISTTFHDQGRGGGLGPMTLTFLLTSPARSTATFYTPEI